MNFELFKLILRQIVVSWPLQDSGFRVNCFSFLDESGDIAKDDFGRNYADYLSGAFWARNWFLSGAEENTMRREFPALLVEWKRTFAHSSASSMVAEVYLTIVQDEDCQGRVLGITEVDIENTTALHNLIRELRSFSEYEIADGFGGTVSAWMPEARATIEGYTAKTGYNLLSHLLYLPESYDNSFFGVEGFRSATCFLRVEICEEGISFDHETKEVELTPIAQ